MALKYKNKGYTRWFCIYCDNDTYYFEINPKWHGLKGLQRTCTKCGVSCFMFELNEYSKILEKEFIEKELKKNER